MKVSQVCRERERKRERDGYDIRIYKFHTPYIKENIERLRIKKCKTKCGRHIYNF